MQMPEPEYRNHSLNSEVLVELKAYQWVEINIWLNLIRESGHELCPAASILIDKLWNEVIATPAYTSALKAAHQQMMEENHPINQIVGMGFPPPPGWQPPLRPEDAGTPDDDS